MKIALIGMPTSGKSYISDALSNQLKYSLIDLDLLIEQYISMSLQDYIITYGEEQFLKVESHILNTTVYPENCIISTGGSVVYCKEEMINLKNDLVKFIYLNVPIDTLEERLKDQRDTRGIIMNNKSSWKELFDDRLSLYEYYSDIKINTMNKNIQEICDEIIENCF